MWRHTKILLTAVLGTWLITSAGRTEGPVQSTVDPESQADFNSDSFTFARVRYDSSGGYGESWYHYEGRDWQRWETDFPRAEQNLLFRLKELTSLKVNSKPVVVRLTDDELRDYPFIFMSDVGWQRLSQRERRALAAYFEAGGFLWVDDFWGEAEWKNFRRNTRKLRDDWEWREIPANHPILSVVYDLKECPQIPARLFYQQTKQTFDPPGVHRYPTGGVRALRNVNFMGLFDAKGRLMSVATHNTDIADGWEREGESKEFFERFSIRSYAISINIIVYAMTH